MASSTGPTPGSGGQNPPSGPIDEWVANYEAESLVEDELRAKRTAPLQHIRPAKPLPQPTHPPSRDTIGESDPALILTTRGAIAACEHNASILIGGATEYAGMFFDDFLGRPRIDGRDWSDADDLQALRWLQGSHRVSGFTIGQARHAARLVSAARRRDSLSDFIVDLPAWDGVERVTMALSDAWGSADTQLARAASKNFFVALIARALRPGSQVDTMWVFEGPQGSLKSKSLRSLGGEFHAEISAAIGTTDFQRELRGLWIAELSELDSLRGKEATTIKRLLSAPHDRYVDKYKTHAETYPRRAVAVATTNEGQYWQDSTGARRLIPIVCGEIRIDIIENLRLQWFAEATQAYKNGDTWWEYPDSILSEQDARQQADPWEDILKQLMVMGKPSIGGITEQWPEGNILSATVMQDWLKLDAAVQGSVSGVRLGKVMRRLGFTPTRTGKDRARGWIMARADGEEQVF